MAIFPEFLSGRRTSSAKRYDDEARRTRHRTRHRSASTKPLSGDTEGPESPKKPTVDELRNIRSEYYSVPPQLRRRQSSPKDQNDGATPLAQAKTTEVDSRRRNVRTRRTHSSQRRSKDGARHNASRSEDRDGDDYVYVYGPQADNSSVSRYPRNVPATRTSQIRQTHSRSRGDLNTGDSRSSMSHTSNRKARRRTEPTIHLSSQNLDTVVEESANDSTNSVQQESNDALPRSRSDWQSRQPRRRTPNEHPVNRPRQGSRAPLRRSQTTPSRPGAFVRPSPRRSNSNSSLALEEPTLIPPANQRPAFQRRRSTSSTTNTLQRARSHQRSTTSAMDNTPEKELECLACASSVPSRQTKTLPCSHTWCKDCLIRLFNSALTDATLMPPRCCSSTEPISLASVQNLFDSSFRKRFNQRRTELATKNRLYCPRQKCNAFIAPDTIHRPLTTPSGGRRRGICPKCETRVCASCKGRWHSGGANSCPKSSALDDEETKKFLEVSAKEGWQRCPSCRSVVEKEVGCNHMRCRCDQEFCYLCGKRWKTCHCELFEDVDDGIEIIEVAEPFWGDLPANAHERRIAGDIEQLLDGFIPENLRRLFPLAGRVPPPPHLLVDFMLEQGFNRRNGGPPLAPNRRREPIHLGGQNRGAAMNRAQGGRPAGFPGRRVVAV